MLSPLLQLPGRRFCARISEEVGQQLPARSSVPGSGLPDHRLEESVKELQEQRGIEMNTTTIGRYIVADPQICHGKPTFRGTRIMVSQVLDQVALGMDWESISDRWEGSITKEAIAEAVRLSGKAFLEHAQEYLVEKVSA